MIVLRRLGGELIALNPDLIERVEVTPDTVVTLVNQKKFLVEESLEEVLDLIIDFRAFVMARSGNLQIDKGTVGRSGPALHVVPTEHVASQEVAASREAFDSNPTPDFLTDGSTEDVINSLMEGLE